MRIWHGAATSPRCNKRKWSKQSLRTESLHHGPLILGGELLPEKLRRTVNSPEAAQLRGLSVRLSESGHLLIGLAGLGFVKTRQHRIIDLDDRPGHRIL